MCIRDSDPTNAYDINMKIEKHAYETYTKYSAWHPEDTKIAEIALDELEHAKEYKRVKMLQTARKALDFAQGID